MTRPSETIQAIAGSIIGAILIVVGWARGGFDLTQMNVEVAGALTLLVSYVSAAVTWYVARKQRAGEAMSAMDGKVT